MRSITKLPIPLLIAAAVFTGVAVIYVYLLAPPMPIHTDPNFTTPLFAGATYLWRGAAFRYDISADNIISVSYRAPYHLVYLFGPLHNISIGDDVRIIYFTIRQKVYYMVRHDVLLRDGSTWRICFLFKLVDVTPENVTIPNLSMYLPTVFGVNETLTLNEFDEIWLRWGQTMCYTVERVIGVDTNGTHIIFRTMWPSAVSQESRDYLPMVGPVTGRTISVTNSPIRTAYTIGGTAYSAIALPYQHFAITPTETTTVIIYVS